MINRDTANQQKQDDGLRNVKINETDIHTLIRINAHMSDLTKQRKSMV